MATAVCRSRSDAAGLDNIYKRCCGHRIRQEWRCAENRAPRLGKICVIAFQGRASAGVSNGDFIVICKGQWRTVQLSWATLNISHEYFPQQWQALMTKRVSTCEIWLLPYDLSARTWFLLNLVLYLHAVDVATTADLGDLSALIPVGDVLLFNSHGLRALLATRNTYSNN